MNTRTTSRPSRSEVFDDAGPVIGAPPIYGPPVLLLLGPWLLLVLLIIPPVAFLAAIALVLAVAALLLAAIAAVVASPYLLVRHLQGHPGIRPRHLVQRLPKPRLRRSRVRSAGLASAQMKGVS